MLGLRDTETSQLTFAEASNWLTESLSNPPVISHVQTRSQRPVKQVDSGRCGSCGRLSDRTSKNYLTIGKQCHNCGKSNHFSSCCPKKPRAETSNTGGTSSSGNCRGARLEGKGNDSHSSRPRVHMKPIVVGNMRTNQRRRPAPTISLQLCDRTGKTIATIQKTTQDGGAEDPLVVWMCCTHWFASLIVHLRLSHGIPINLSIGKRRK